MSNTSVTTIATAIAIGIPTCVAGLGAASSATGAAIMQAAGWTAANGAAIVTVGTTASAGAAGFATLFAPFIVCATAATVFKKYGIEPKTATGVAAGSSITCAALAGVIGAAELNLKGIELGYVVASTAAGTPIIEAGFGVLACITMCSVACCAKLSNSNTTTNRTVFFNEPTAVAPFPHAMGDTERTQPPRP